MAVPSFEDTNLQAVLEKIAIKEGFKKPTFSIGDGSEPGRNYIGRVIRTVITENQDGIEKSLSLIFKASSTNKERHNMICGDLLFRNEKDMYEVVLPTLNNFLKKHGVADHPVFPGTPRCFEAECHNVTTNNKFHVLVLEDKSVQGFKAFTIREGLTGDQCRVALKRIALLHATSMALHELEPETAERLEKLIKKNYTGEAFMRCLEEFKVVFKNALGKYLLDLVFRRCDNVVIVDRPTSSKLLEDQYIPGDPTYEKLRHMLDNFSQEFISIRDGRPKDHYSIGHTDFTANNLLFKLNEDGLAEDACILDFQTARCVRIADDLAVLLLLCTKKEVRDEHFANLVKFYFDEVTKTLRGFGCDSEKVFPWELFQKHLRESMKTGVLYCLLCLPVMFVDSSDAQSDIHSETSSGYFSGLTKVTDPEETKQLKQRLQDIISDAVKWGFK